ncbi:MAG: M20 family metallopeptidase, partial [Microgenomates group bacterium]
DRRLLENMVTIPSSYPSEYELGEYLERYLSSNGFNVASQQVAADRHNIFATKGRGHRAILFYGHLDTVPLTSRAQWQTDPFSLTEIDGNLFGLGTYDMKGGISAFVEACANSKSYCKILLTVDEENWSAGIWKAIAEKSDFFDDVELIISAEPNFGLGLNGVTNARTSRYLYTVTFDGKPAHVANYQDGVDAVNILGKFIADFYATREELFHVNGSYAQIRSVGGSAMGMSVCGISTAEIEVLAAPGETLESVRLKIQSLTTFGVIPKTRPTPYLPGYIFTAFPYQDTIREVIKKHTGLDMELKSRKSVADDNALATLGIPVITWGPDGGNAHAPNEYVKINSLNILSKMYLELLNNKEKI